MTLIVGLAHGGCVYMGTDSAEAGVNNLSVRRDPQIVWKGPFLFGIPGIFRLENLVRYYLDISTDDPELDVRGYLTTRVAAPLREWLQKKQFEVPLRTNSRLESRPELRDFQGLLLIGYPGRLCQVGPAGQLVEALDGYDALGTGDEIALGALRATRNEAPELRVFSALHAAEYLSGAVRAPFHVYRLSSGGQCVKCADTLRTPIAYRP